MPWFIPAVFVSTLLLSALLYGKALKHIEHGSNPVKVAFLGTLASDEHFTPVGRRYRMWSVALALGGALAAALLYLLSSAP